MGTGRRVRYARHNELVARFLPDSLSFGFFQELLLPRHVPYMAVSTARVALISRDMKGWDSEVFLLFFFHC